jgi:UDP:flavonoid glycosyltransferase YjiC (YdhE family)
MRVLFSSFPAYGHFFPQLPLARAFARRGDRVAFMISEGFAPVLAAEGFERLAGGPEMDSIFAESISRTGQHAASNPTPESVAELFAGTRLDLSKDEALAEARDWAPDLIVNELFDLLGAFVAAALDVPSAIISFGPATPPEFLEAIAANAAPHFEAAGLVAPTTLPAGRWRLETCPVGLGASDSPTTAERWTLRPEAHRGPGAPGDPGLGTPALGRPRVLVTFGSFFADPAVVGALIDGLTSGPDAIDAEFIGTALPMTEPPSGPHRIVPFQPLSELLEGVSAVVTHGGAGTVLGTLSKGIPLVVVPQGADQFVQAAAVERAGCGVATDPGRPAVEQLRAAVRKVLDDPALRAGAVAIEKEIAVMTPPEQVAEDLAKAL